MTADDVEAFLGLVDALADYEHLARPQPDARQRLAADATADPPRFNVLVADLDGEVVGYAVWFLTYSTFLARPSLYLEDLFVVPAARGRGAGAALFRACVQEAQAQGCGRMEWQVLTWNTPAIEFYTRLGARQLSDWYSFRLDPGTFSPHAVR
jgi:GNAT superfamily N-acetyltransferase